LFNLNLGLLLVLEDLPPQQFNPEQMHAHIFGGHDTALQVAEEYLNTIR